MNKQTAPPQQASIFSDDGICVVCGRPSPPTLVAGNKVTLLWCTNDCTRIYAQRWMTPKQSAFVDEYLVDLNAAKAAARAGYSLKTAVQIGNENLRKPLVQQALALAMLERSQRTQITTDKVLTDIELVKQDAMRLVAENQTMITHAAALRACELHGKHLKMFTDKLDVSGGMTLNVITGVPDADDEQ